MIDPVKRLHDPMTLIARNPRAIIADVQEDAFLRYFQTHLYAFRCIFTGIFNKITDRSFKQWPMAGNGTRLGRQLYAWIALTVNTGFQQFV